MNIYEDKPVTKVEKVLVRKVCDVCKKDIVKNKYFYGVSTSHSDWGNDSIDSYEYNHICSETCLNKKFNEYIECDDDTKKIEIERIRY